MSAQKFLPSALMLALIVIVAMPAVAEPTNIVVRVISRDAKFIGTSMGGAQITLRDSKTGEVLAEGKTAGGTGDTELLMKRSQTRRDLLSSEDAAKFSATIDLNAPKLVEVVAVGPIVAHDNTNRVSATQWVLPGKHLEGGDGWILEMPGFFVDLQGPSTELEVQQGAESLVEFKADIKMMCGCPIEPGGLWNADEYEIKAQLKKAGEVIGETTMKYAGHPSQFSGFFKVGEPGTYQVVVYAYDAHNGNTGLDTAEFELKLR